MDRDRAQMQVVELVRTLPFNAGRSLLVKILSGEKDEQIKKLSLHKSPFFGTLGLLQKEEIMDLIESLIFRGSLEVERNQRTGFLPLIKLGKPLPRVPAEEEKGEIPSTDYSAYGDFLDKFNEEQKRAITSKSKKILCIAGAGSGKTTVLAKRISFLIEKEGINPDRILAITFTRKAKHEMQERISSSTTGRKVNIETFNSFSERYLRKYEDLAYGRNFRVMGFSERIAVATQALMQIGLNPDEALDDYSGDDVKNGLSKNEKYLMMVNDIYTIIDSYKNNGEDLSTFESSAKCLFNGRSRRICLLCSRWAQRIEQIKNERGLRDFTDQMQHCIRLFATNPQAVPRFSHILVDEFQDVNSLQVKLLSLLKGESFFAVGDPRQSIFGWRGSKIEYILAFKEDHPEAEIIELSRNYRSTPEIVSVANTTINPMRLSPLISELPSGEDVNIVKHSGEEEEALFVAQAVLNSPFQRNEIFVLARTNKQLEQIGRMFDRFGIKYLKRTIEEEKQDITPTSDEVTLSTVHAIKGLEADMVFLVGANSQNYPCRKEEHPVLEIAKVDDYDKYQEELRVFYVGITRARKKLVISFYNNLTRFIDRHERRSKGVMERLTSWRMKKAKEMSVPPDFIISDKALFELSRYRPESVSELENSNILEKGQVDNYGKDIVRISSGL